MYRTRQVVTGILALAVTLAILVGLPAALVAHVGWPLPTTWPTLDQLAELDRTGISETAIIKALAIVVWLTWAQLTIAITVETVALLRRTATRTRRMLPGLQPVAARLVAAIALIAAASATTRVSAATPLAAAVALEAPAILSDLEPPPVHAPFERDDQSDAAEPTTTIEVTERDSWWRIAEEYLGDGMRWREVRNLNIGRGQADGTVIDATTEQLRGGWLVVVPGPPVGTAGPPRPYLSAAADWSVDSGDHFWGVAEQTLTDAWGRAPTDEEVVPYWKQLIDANRDRLLPPHDPDVIYPDQRFTLPAPPTDPAADVGPPAVVGSTELAAPDDPERVESPVRPVGSIPAGDVAAPAPRTMAHPDGWATAIERQSIDGGRDLVPWGDGTDADVDYDSQNGLGVPVGLIPGVAATTLLAAGLTALLRWRRRAALRRRPERYRLPTPWRGAAEAINRLEAATPPERTLDDIASLLASIPPDTHPALVTLRDDGTVRLLFDDTASLPSAPDPWVLANDGADGPVGWTSRIGVRGPERSIGLPLLVTLGRTGETSVLANVAALPRLAVDGDDEDVTRLLRVMAMEVATTRVAVPVEVVVCGDHLLGTLDNVRFTQHPLGEIQAATAEVRQGVIPEDRTPRLIVCHAGTDPPYVSAELIGTVGVIATAKQPSSWMLDIADRRAGRLVLPDGGTVELDLPDVDPWEIDHQLRTLEHGCIAQPQPPPGPEPVPAEPSGAMEEPKPEPTTNGRPHPLVRPRRASEPAFCEVRLLGPIEIYRAGELVEGIPPRSLEVLAYLATHRDGVSKERLDDAIWAGQAGLPGSQRVNSAMNKLREPLGDGPDGELLVPRRLGAERIRLSDHVGCDLDRAFAHVAVARDLPGEAAAPELEAALDLVRGEAFQDLPVSWASDIIQRAIAELQDAALDLARIHRGAGDYEAAERALRLGLRLLDPADALYLELAEVAKARGRPDRVPQLWDQLRRRHAENADEVGGLVSAPPAEIELAFHELLHR